MELIQLIWWKLLGKKTFCIIIPGFQQAWSARSRYHFVEDWSERQSSTRYGANVKTPFPITFLHLGIYVTIHLRLFAKSRGRSRCFWSDLILN